MTDITTWLLALSVTLPRIAASFIVLPLLSQDAVPALVRNSIFVGLALVVSPLTIETINLAAVKPLDWPFILIKEIFIGITIGFFFASIFWAISIAGGIIDTQMGNNMSQTMDPLQGSNTTLTGLWFSRFASVLFLTSGGFLIFLGVLLKSYRIWPPHSFLPNLTADSGAFFIYEFEYIMVQAMLFAAPVITVLALVDLSMGLINRFAQQLNVLALSSSLKTWLGTWVALLCLGLMVELVVRKLFENEHILARLQIIFS
ncbi:type III secretory pathway needle complex export protein [Oleiphilus messinensis]|uniref:Type III secretory pathway needle complex export protein n=1 Tax=Oleiphilus messinensis TaxID=141451 RepID=A0A1Y0IIU9_9GAMM|nr:type III secretion system export apparatus subunit SctT [Oleiphilus messinensis]ARU59445.1 type III secretory pathway needle complex export protein [Oleiphilus messinensis]